MRTRAFVAIAFGGIFLSAVSAKAANCRDISYAAERTKLERYLSSNGFSRGEQAFLSKGADQRIKDMPQRRLNERGAACGIKAVRAQVLGCLNQLLPSTLPPPERRTGKSLWSKANISARESLVIGMFHGCRASALELFFSAK